MCSSEKTELRDPQAINSPKATNMSFSVREKLIDGAQEYAEENDNEKDLRRDIDYFATKAQGALEVANLAEDKD